VTDIAIRVSVARGKGVSASVSGRVARNSAIGIGRASTAAFGRGVIKKRLTGGIETRDGFSDRLRNDETGRSALLAIDCVPAQAIVNQIEMCTGGIHAGFGKLWKRKDLRKQKAK
jgi:hypothetical protein